MIMGKYMKEEVEKALGDSNSTEPRHYRFAARLNWKGEELRNQDLSGLNNYLVYVGEESDEEKHTGIQKSTLQGYFLKRYDSGTCEDFVFIGLQNPNKKNSLWGIEMFCSGLILGTVINGAFYQTVEANDLKQVHGPKKND
jgi:hypothetical protein